jgi:hypothetical protein
MSRIFASCIIFNTKVPPWWILPSWDMKEEGKKKNDGADRGGMILI